MKGRAAAIGRGARRISPPMRSDRDREGGVYATGGDAIDSKKIFPTAQRHGGSEISQNWAGDFSRMARAKTKNRGD